MSLLALTNPVIGEEMRLFRIGTGGAGATYYPVGGLIGLAISNPPGSRPCNQGGSCGVPGLLAVVQSANGSVANVESIHNGTLESGFVQSDIAYWAYSGSGTFQGEQPFRELRLIANLYPESFHLIVSKESGIRSPEDLRGKRISLGEAGSGTLTDAKLLIAAYGLTTEDMRSEYSKTAQAVEKMRDHRLDGFFHVAGYPIPIVSALAREMPIRLVPITGAVADKMVKEIPFFALDKIPGGTYSGVDETPTLSVGAQWVTSSAQSEQLIYQITKALWNSNSRKLLDSGHKKGRAITLQTALHGSAIPLHPGAARYYREMGLLKGPGK